MGLFELLQLLIIGLYLVGTVLFLVGTAAANPRLRRLAGILAVAGFALHTVDIALVFVQERGVALNASGTYLSILAWSILVIYFFFWWRFRLEFMALTVLPLALLFFLTSMTFSGIRVVMPKQLTMLFFGLHIGTLVLALGVLVMGFGAALAFLHYNKKIKTKAGLRSLGKDTPSLSIFDRVNHMVVAIGFPLYTLGLFSSFVWYWIAPGKMFVWDVMKISSLAVWGAFAFLFHQRMLLGWKGRKPAILMIIVFAAMVVSLLHHTITFRQMP
ncbi:cytochrome C assembly family protein [Pseudodesulfovibrio senegalensis]|uniref:Cytochrome C assembly protein n=1 Tax=Pseudodesulfovibrio senegalensis TaxID=1721087 RepID=A0A6N6N9V0_9BACT|nr:cytochrome c biogenesis protein CcsA [Pseudodesulfovibrio senegalensis]KAB1443809.1 cytochrome C assembly protein [Pseudodesulfovibrio senegalensis]